MNKPKFVFLIVMATLIFGVIYMGVKAPVPSAQEVAEQKETMEGAKMLGFAMAGFEYPTNTPLPVTSTNAPPTRFPTFTPTFTRVPPSRTPKPSNTPWPTVTETSTPTVTPTSTATDTVLQARTKAQQTQTAHTQEMDRRMAGAWVSFVEFLTNKYTLAIGGLTGAVLVMLWQANRLINNLKRDLPPINLPPEHTLYDDEFTLIRYSEALYGVNSNQLAGHRKVNWTGDKWSRVVGRLRAEGITIETKIGEGSYLVNMTLADLKQYYRNKINLSPSPPSVTQYL